MTFLCSIGISAPNPSSSFPPLWWSPHCHFWCYKITPIFGFTHINSIFIMYIWWSERDKQWDIRLTKNTTVLESERHLKMRHCRLAPVAETGFSHRLTAYKIVGHFFDCHIGKYGPWSGRKYFFLESATFRFHAGMLSSEVAHAGTKKLWTFIGPWGRVRSQSPPCWIFRVKQIHQSTAWEGTTRLTVGLQERLQKPRWRKIRDTVIYKQDGIIIYF